MDIFRQRGFTRHVFAYTTILMNDKCGLLLFNFVFFFFGANNSEAIFMLWNFWFHVLFGYFAIQYIFPNII